jgi:hypothetical protein
MLFFSSSCFFIMGSSTSRLVPVRKISGRIMFLIYLKVSLSLKISRIFFLVFFKSFSFLVFSNFLNSYFSFTKFTKTCFRFVNKKSVLRSKK